MARHDCGVPVVGDAANQVLAGDLVQPLYINPFNPAIPIGPLAVAIVAEVERRMHTAARAAKAVRHG